MVKIGEVRLSVAVFETPECCGECPFSIYSSYDGRVFCRNPEGPGKVEDSERHRECPIQDFVMDVTFGNKN